MSESLSFAGIEPPSPTLSARLGELADFFAAPTAGRLTDEQRALSLGIARRLVADVAARIDPAIDSAALWADWLLRGIPDAARLVGVCFARAEEHRWRALSAERMVPAPLAGAADEASGAASDAPMTARERAYLGLRIADRRRLDAYGQPKLAIADVDEDIFRVLLHEVAAWRLAEVSIDTGRAASLGDAVRHAVERQADEGGMTAAAIAYHEAVGTALPETARMAIAAHDWPALIALAAAAQRRRYADMALSLLTAETAALPSLLAPLRLDRDALALLEASLAMLPARAVNDADGAAPEAGR
ncbi:hypothetical protein [Sphingopyxis sp. LK2115]|uniref:hypothetical protein n=1 Tax=Sphingopyxis sp. LK2115 TaxID=2744558 RepID=UPI00166066A4|nr:hypothetical protein [Sphingopyxis sp. LK2115]